MGQQIRVLLKGQKITVEGVGFVGAACDKAMAAIETALGTVKKRENKAEYFNEVETEHAPQERVSG